jgi:hypothetical protein
MVGIDEIECPVCGKLAHPPNAECKFDARLGLRPAPVASHLRADTLLTLREELVNAVQALLDTLPICTEKGCLRTAVLGRQMCNDHGGITSAFEDRFAKAIKRLEALGFHR